MTPLQRDLDNAVLLILYEEANVTGHGLTAPQIAAKFTVPPVTAARVLMALQHHAKEGFADSGGHFGMVAGYKITRKGVDRVESGFERNDRGDDTNYNERAKGAGATGDRASDVGELVQDLKKIEHLVLLQFHVIARGSAELTSAREITESFRFQISPRRVELALDQLVKKGFLESEFLPVGKPGWRIARAGIEFVDRQLTQPASFIARYSRGGDEWLASDEARRARIATTDQGVGSDEQWVDPWKDHEFELTRPTPEDGDYLDFADKVLVAIADEQEPPGLRPVNLEALCNRHAIPAHPTWIKLVGNDLQGRGLGENVGSGPTSNFLLNGIGLNSANVVRRSGLAQGLEPEEPRRRKVDWAMIGAVGTILSIAVAIFLWLVG